MCTASEQAEIRKLRYKLKNLGYSIKTIPKRFNYLGDYAVIMNDCRGIILYGSIEDIQDFLARESA